MSYIFKLPDVGEGINEGEIVQWFVKEGDIIQEDAPMLEVQNDKLLQEVPSPVTGTILKILVAPGAVAVVGDPLIEIAVSGSAPKGIETKEEAKDIGKEEKAEKTENSEKEQQDSGISHTDNTIAGRILALPSVRQYAREQGIDITKVEATGKHGHVTKANVDTHQQSGSTTPVVDAYNQSIPNIPEVIVSVPTVDTTSTPIEVPVKAIAGEVTREKFTVTRKAIAKAMVNSSTKIPHVTIFDEVEVSKLVEHRQRFKEVAASNDVKLTYLPYLVKAVIAMTRKFPILNASVDEASEETIYKNFYHVGIAVDTPQGLYVPNIKHADAKGIFTIAREISTLTEAAKASKLAGADMRGGTITITNIGSAGGLWFTPIINHPEVAIVGVGRMDKKPVVKDDGSIGIGTMLALSISFDHRVVDGKTAQLAMNELKRLLGEPELLLMEG